MGVNKASRKAFRASYVLPMTQKDSTQIIQDGVVVCQDGIIQYVGEATPQLIRDLGPTLIERKNEVILPGLINAHTHLPMTLFRGRSDDLPFEDWLFKTILPLEQKWVSPEFVRIGTRLAALESIRFGVTTLADMYFFENEIAQVCDEAGLRGIFAEAFTDFENPDTKTNRDQSFYIFDQMKERYQGHPRIQAALGPHAPYSCGDDLLKRVLRLVEKTDTLIHIHVSETEFEVQESLKKWNKTPGERLIDLGFGDTRCLFAHGVYLTDSEMKTIQNKKIGIAYNPESNMKLGSGIAPVTQMMDHKISIGLGTDGAASNNDLNLFREMDSGAKLQKLAAHKSEAFTANHSLFCATLGGAQALGLDHITGSLEVGKAADLISLSLDHPHLTPVHDLFSTLVYSANGSEVTLTVCHGEILFDQGEYKTLELDSVLKEAKELASRF